MADGRILNFDNPAIYSAVTLAQKAFNEEPVQIMWNMILTTWFPAIGSQVFKVAIKSPSLASNGEPDGIVIEVRFVGGRPRDSTGLEEWQIFMVECKPPDHDTPTGWRDATEQLDDYLLANTNPSRKLFAAIAIGTRVIVYQWERVNFKSITRPIHPGILDLSEGEDRATFETTLDVVKSQGWTDAVSSHDPSMA